MAKLCPLKNMELCHDDCAWRSGEDCSVKVLAESTIDKIMKERFIRTFLPNVGYGVTKFNNYTNADCIKKGENNENT